MVTVEPETDLSPLAGLDALEAIALFGDDRRPPSPTLTDSMAKLVGAGTDVLCYRGPWSEALASAETGVQVVNGGPSFIGFTASEERADEVRGKLLQLTTFLRT